ncbi:MAG: phospholipid carrier-dependent glycosyltransferase [Moorea sp. SIO4A5]|nr:phospholipid carrier-dependent glycosyltransferase [Moorena sp. SIO4A5]NEO24393.1 phospholipid carrier-dependent glycosyltransferase [Moorena sp. SIO4A5]
MILPKKPSHSSIPWFSIGMTAIVLLSLALRFWGLGRFNRLVFDEVYYAIFANNYLTGTSFFNPHPPLSQYIIAIGIWIGSHLPFGQDTVNELTGSLRSTWSYRWLNALTGSLIPIVVAALAYQLNRRRSYALIAALFAATDGLFLVESRYALNNIYLVILGLLGQLFFLLALNHQAAKSWLMLILSGVFFGASAAIKWNGLWFLLGIYIVWAVAWVWQLFRTYFGQTTRTRSIPSGRHPLQNLTQLNIGHILLNLVILPVVTYSLLWIPHLLMNPSPGFWESQVKILTFHQNVGSGTDVHPYCSRWYTWLLMWRPVAYFYQTASHSPEAVPTDSLLSADASNVIYDVHAMGNPFLWWLSTTAILLLLLLLTQRILEGVGWKSIPTSYTWITLYLIVNYAANLLPWTKVTRCTFLYHYMGASVFSGLALAWLVDRWLHSEKNQYRSAGFTVILVVVLAFIFWLPIYLGLPLSESGYQLRMWFRSWI